MRRELKRKVIYRLTEVGGLTLKKMQISENKMHTYPQKITIEKGECLVLYMN